MSKRLPPPYGAWIDRDRPVSFRFDGRDYTGFAGDTLTTALWAAGERVLGRSFKYHRPRGIYSLGDVDANCIVEDKQRTNLRGDCLPIHDGLDVRSVNTIGSARNDWMRLAEWASLFMPVGFYYKAFHTPRAMWPFYERLLRRAAGLGAIRAGAPFRPTPKCYDFCDVLVVGSGPSGLQAAITAAAADADVLLVETQPRLGGTLWFDARPQARENLLARVGQFPNLRARVATTAVSIDPDNWVALVDTEKLVKLRAETIILATGCHDQGAIFKNNDLPGVMLAEAAEKLLHGYGIPPCSCGVVATANARGYRVALNLADAGVKVAGILDLRTESEQGPVAEELRSRGIALFEGCTVEGAVPARGKRGITAVRFRGQGQAYTVTCDGILCSTGYVPNDTLFRQAGGCMTYRADSATFLPEHLPEMVFAAGRLNGVHHLDARLADGTAAAKTALALRRNRHAAEVRPARDGQGQTHPYPVMDTPAHKAFVDLDEDVQLHDIEQSLHEGFDSPELLKRYATVGMGPSQGKHGNLLALRIVARKQDRSLEGLHLTTARPYATPVPLGHLAGRCFTPRQRTGMHAWHERHGAEFLFAGDWLRPAYYARQGGNAAQWIEAEARQVREAAGLIDLGTLGKLEVAGPDAVEFLERTYTGRFKKLAAGKARYAIMCDEAGILIDDGIVARLAEDHFYLSTTTSGAASVYREMQRNILKWRMDVRVVNATAHFGAMSLAGPKYKEVLAQVCDADLSDDAFPHVGVRTCDVAGVPTRVLRLGFVSESGYEIHVPAGAALRVWEALIDAGAPLGLCAYGVETQRLLRCEMGHIIIGRDTDALTNPFEVGMEWALKMEKPYFVGQRSLRILAARPRHRQLVGFVLEPNHTGAIPQDCHLIIEKGDIVGRVTSVYRSPTLARIFGLAFVRPELAEPGTSFRIRVNSETVRARVAKLPFL